MPQQEIELILLRQWASYLSLPVFLMDRAGKLIFYNEPAEAILGRRYDEVGEIPLEALSDTFETTAEDGSPIDTDDLLLTIALRDLRPAHRRFCIKTFDGELRTIEATAFPIEGAGNRHLGAVALFWEARP